MSEHFPVGDPSYDAPDIQAWLNTLPEKAKDLARRVPIGAHIKHGLEYVVTGYTGNGDFVLLTPLVLMREIGEGEPTEFQVHLPAAHIMRPC